MIDDLTIARTDSPPGWSPNYERRVLAFRVIDGDTVELMIDQGFHECRVETFRFAGFDAFETRGPNRLRGRQARDRLQRMLQDADGIKVVSERSSRGQAEQGKYGRWIATLFVYHASWHGGWHEVSRILATEGFEKPRG